MQKWLQMKYASILCKNINNKNFKVMSYLCVKSAYLSHPPGTCHFRFLLSEIMIVERDVCDNRLLIGM